MERLLYSSQSDAADESEVLHPEGFGLRKAALVSIFAGFVCLSGLGNPVRGQEPGGFGGVWTLGAEYSHVLRKGPRFRFDYEASVMPVWEERDPTVTGTEFFVSGQEIVTPQTPVRVVNITHLPVGNILTGNDSFAPVYALFGTENTYAAAITPLGARVSAMPRWRVQPTFAIDLGFVFSSRDIPIDDATQFNFSLAMGPGIQFYSDAHTLWRVEYVYRHFSNAGQGNENPGVDQGVVRVTVSRHR